MRSVALVRPISSVAWELRSCWSKGLRVSLAMDGDEKRVEGHVTSVSPTSAFALVGGLHCPLDRVLAVYRPSRLGDSSFREGETWGGPIPEGARRDLNQLSLF